MNEGLAARVTEGLQAELRQLRELLFEEQMHAAEMERCAVECAAANERLTAQLAEVGGWRDTDHSLPPEQKLVEITTIGKLINREYEGEWFVGIPLMWRPIADEGDGDASTD